MRVPDAPALWADGRIRAELPRRTILLVAPQADALRLSGDVEATIALPLRARALWQALSTHGRSAEAPKALQLHARVLVADDVEINREVVRQLLEQIGCTVDLAASGVEALDVMERTGGAIDLVVSDVVMPEMDGPSLLRELRRTRPDLKIIIVSGYAEDAFRKNLPEGESFNFLPKPFSLKQLATAVKETLGE